MTIVEQVAEFAVAVREKGLRENLRHDGARRVMDVLGNSLAATPLEPARIVTALADEWGGNPVATAIGSRPRYPAHAAALVNGTLAHALDFDDTHLPSVLHPSASVVPTAIAAAEAAGSSGAALLDAVGVGVEVCVRLGMAGYDPELGNSIFFERGLHATAICGAVGSAVAAAMIAGLDASGVASAAGIAASMGAGLLEANRTGGTVKRVHCGWAAHAGISAAALARHGMTGPPTVIEGRFGFLQAYCGDRGDPVVVVHGLGTRWELARVFFKPYPCNHFTHAGIDAAMRLRAEGLHPHDVEDIELGVAKPVLRTIAEPPEHKARPETGYAAAFSGPYTVAAALMGGGGLGLFHEDFTDDMARDERRRALAARVRCVEDARCNDVFPHQFPAVLRVRTRTGRTVEARVEVNRGGPENPLSDEELATKFRLNASRHLGADQADEVAETTRRLVELDDVRQLTRLLAA